MKKVLQVEVLKRFMNDKSIGELMDQYDGALYQVRNIKKPSDKDLRIAKMVRETLSYRQVGKKLGLTTYQVISAVGRVGTYKN